MHQVLPSVRPPARVQRPDVRPLARRLIDTYRLEHWPAAPATAPLLTLAPRPVTHPPPPIRLLDLGAGQGQDAAAFAQAGLDVVALDLTLPARKSPLCPESVAWVVGDAREPLPFEDGSFDYVYSHYVLSSNFQSWQIEVCLQEVARILRPDGTFWLAVRSTDDPTYRKSRQPGTGYFPLGETGLHFFSLKTTRKYLQLFDIINIQSSNPILDGEQYGAIEVIAQVASSSSARPTATIAMTARAPRFTWANMR